MDDTCVRRMLSLLSALANLGLLVHQEAHVSEAMEKLAGASASGHNFRLATHIVLESPVSEERLDWLADVGFGLRLALTRSASGKVVHIDVAFPLNGDPSIDNVQFLIKSRQSF